MPADKQMTFKITLLPLDDTERLHRLWLDLQQRAVPSYFLTWSWIGCWLEHTGERPLVLEARSDDRVIALALIQSSNNRSQGRFPAKCLYLHETGKKKMDRLTIEYNGILADAEIGNQAVKACIDFLIDDKRHVPKWDELYLSGVDPLYAEHFRGRSDLRLTPREKGSASVDLDAIRSAGKQYIDSLSSNTRYQVRRAIRLYEKSGNLSITPAVNADMTMSYLKEIEPLHIQYWTQRGSDSGFSDPFFKSFHEAQITRGLQSGETELLRITAGSELIGYLYNFIYNRKVYFYLSAFHYQDDPKIKPGLVSHALAVQYYLDKGLSIYDFMAGDARYKSNLGNSKSKLYWLIVQRKKLKFTMEEFLRASKQAIERAIKQ